jgi:hypothetical protein
MANFVWNPAKAARNLKEHKVSFEAARRVFDDPLGIDEIDDREDYCDGAVEHPQHGREAGSSSSHTRRVDGTSA